MRSVRALLIGLASAVVAAIPLAGCNEGSPDDRIVRTTENRPEVLRDGRLESQPSPLTVADINRQPPNSPQKAVLELLFFAQWGGLPNVTRAYIPEVVRRVTEHDLSGAYALQRSTLATLLPRVIGVRRSTSGRLVAVRFASATGPPVDDSFVLRRLSGQWKVVHDTFLERALAQFAVTRVDPSPTPSARAQRAGLAAVERFRAASRRRSAPRRRTPRPPAPRPSPGPQPPTSPEPARPGSRTSPAPTPPSQ